MRIAIFLLIVGVCLVSAKYLPRGSDAHLRIKRSVDSDDDSSSSVEQIKKNSDIDDEGGDDDSDDSSENKLKEKQAKEQRKQEEKREKEERKRLERLEKAKRKEEEKRRKDLEKLEKEERKKQKKQLKELEKLKKEALEDNYDEDFLETEEESSVELANVWRNHIYVKYGLTLTSSRLEKQAALNRYLQEELKLNQNSTESERRQAIVQLIQSKLQANATSRSALKNQLLSHINDVSVQKLRQNLEKDLEELNNKTNILNNVSLPWVPLAKQQIEEKRSFIQTIMQLLSNILPNWVIGGQNDQNPNNNNNNSSTVSGLGNSDINESSNNITENNVNLASEGNKPGNDIVIGDNVQPNPTDSSPVQSFPPNALTGSGAVENNINDNIAAVTSASDSGSTGIGASPVDTIGSNSIVLSEDNVNLSSEGNKPGNDIVIGDNVQPNATDSSPVQSFPPNALTGSGAVENNINDNIAAVTSASDSVSTGIGASPVDMIGSNSIVLSEDNTAVPVVGVNTVSTNVIENRLPAATSDSNIISPEGVNVNNIIKELTSSNNTVDLVNEDVTPAVNVNNIISTSVDVVSPGSGVVDNIPPINVNLSGVVDNDPTINVNLSGVVDNIPPINVNLSTSADIDSSSSIGSSSLPQIVNISLISPDEVLSSGVIEATLDNDSNIAPPSPDKISITVADSTLTVNPSAVAEIGSKPTAIDSANTSTNGIIDSTPPKTPSVVSSGSSDTTINDAGSPTIGEANNNASPSTDSSQGKEVNSDINANSASIGYTDHILNANVDEGSELTSENNANLPSTNIVSVTSDITSSSNINSASSEGNKILAGNVVTDLPITDTVLDGSLTTISVSSSEAASVSLVIAPSVGPVSVSTVSSSTVNNGDSVPSDIVDITSPVNNIGASSVDSELVDSNNASLNVVENILPTSNSEVTSELSDAASISITETSIAAIENNATTAANNIDTANGNSNVDKVNSSDAVPPEQDVINILGAGTTNDVKPAEPADTASPVIIEETTVASEITNLPQTQNSITETLINTVSISTESPIEVGPGNDIVTTVLTSGSENVISSETPLIQTSQTSALDSVAPIVTSTPLELSDGITIPVEPGALVVEILPQ